jgi:hypothetical protein
MAFTPLHFAKGAIMQWAGNKVTDHNRDDLSIDFNRIETAKRMANGTMRKYVIADKRTYSTAWNDLPHSAAFTVDGFWGGSEMLAFYKANAGLFVLKLTAGDGTTESVNVMFTKFSYDVTKRGVYDFWHVSVEMEEV